MTLIFPGQCHHVFPSSSTLVSSFHLGHQADCPITVYEFSFPSYISTPTSSPCFSCWFSPAFQSHAVGPCVRYSTLFTSFLLSFVDWLMTATSVLIPRKPALACSSIVSTQLNLHKVNLTKATAHISRSEKCRAVIEPGPENSEWSHT